MALQGADIFGFGMVLWEMVTGEHAWGGLPYGQIVKLVVRQKQQPPLPSDTPRQLRVSSACTACQIPFPACQWSSK